MHIMVVTCGVLIALGLEGVRETIHDHRLVRDTRENVKHELSMNLGESADEFSRVTLYSKELKALIADLPVLAQQRPEQINKRLAEIDNPGYFFLSNSWQAALSTGALEHMSTEEVSAYGDSSEAIRIYSGLQAAASTEEVRTKSFFLVHPNPTPEQLEEGTERLLLFSNAEESLAYVAPQMRESMERSIRTASN